MNVYIYIYIYSINFFLVAPKGGVAQAQGLVGLTPQPALHGCERENVRGEEINMDEIREERDKYNK